MRQLRGIGLAVVVMAASAGRAGATPTTNIWNPNTDVQAAGTWHLGIDNYFSISDNVRNPVAFPTTLGLTYGVGAGFEVGVDLAEPAPNPFLFNAKWGLPERAGFPAVAVGIQAVGTTRATQANIAYALLAKSFAPVGRFTAGGYRGSRRVLGEDRSGVILAWDRAFGERWWGSVDWASGNNIYGALGVGASYKIAPNVALLAGYVFFNDRAFNANDTATVQVDIEL